MGGMIVTYNKNSKSAASLPRRAAGSWFAILLAAGGSIFAAPPEQAFNRIATFPVIKNYCLGNMADSCLNNETLSEIVAAAENGRTLIYTDSENNAIGFVDISNPRNPVGLGTLNVGGSPTSVAVKGNHAIVTVDMTSDFAAPAGMARVVQISSRSIVTSIDLGGQPDAIDISPDHRYAVIAMENQRDEDEDWLSGGQTPPGRLIILDLIPDNPTQWGMRTVTLTGWADKVGGDPEPEYVDINENNLAVVTLQENNHIVIVDVATGNVVKDFPAGTANLTQIDTIDSPRPNLINLVNSVNNVPREPDAVAWISATQFVTADEGDLTETIGGNVPGGTRGWTVYDIEGNIKWTSGFSVEHAAVRVGHYPDRRSDNKGAEPEGIAYGKYGSDRYFFVATERSGIVLVYRIKDGAAPELVQVLPSTSRPEGVLAIPNRKLLVTSGEEDSRSGNLRAGLTIYELQAAPAEYPTIVSANRTNSQPIPWGALSGLAADTSDAKTAYSIYDSFYARSRIFKLDLSRHPAVITHEIELRDVNGNPKNYDPEGIAKRPGNHGFWIASEGAQNCTAVGTCPSNRTFNLLLEVSEAGQVLREIQLPAAVNDRQRSNGYEGVAAVGTPGVDEFVYVAFQREWLEDPVNRVRIGRYEVSSGEWKFFYYPIEPPMAPLQSGEWVGLSEITAIDNNTFAVIERDNRGSLDAQIKRVYKFSVSGVAPVAQGGTFPTLTKTLMKDVLPDLKSFNGQPLEKIEGMAKLKDGNWIMVSDNDGVDGSNGETQLWSLGKLQ